MPECKPSNCPVHEDVIEKLGNLKVKLTSVSSKMVVLLGLVSIFVAVVVYCVTIAVAACDKADVVGGKYEVHAAASEERTKAIQAGLARIDKRCERIEEILRKE